MKYDWASYGDSKNPVIALIATSDGFEGEEGQKILLKRIDVLIKKGFCVKVPKYEDGTIVVQPDVSERKVSDRMTGTVTPAVDAETGANQIIDCIESGWNMMPLIGGDSFEKKIPLIVDYFEKHHEHKRPDVKIFGFSNSTYATILASHGICSFISTPFTSVFTTEGFEEQASALESVMKGHGAEVYPRTILCDELGTLDDLEKTYHYSVNFGNIVTEVELAKKGDTSLSLSTKHGDWSLGFEGFLQRPGNFLPVNYPHFLDQFLKKHESNLPKFIEIGNFATRLDGANGYAKLQHDPESGLILIEENVEKILRNQKKLKEDVAKIAKEKKALEQKPEKTFPEQKALKILSLIPQDIFEKSQSKEEFNENDVREILKSQNEIIMMIMEDIKKVADKFKIPLILNTRNGHCANMSIVNGGMNSISIEDRKVMMTMVDFPTKSPSTQTPAKQLDNSSKAHVAGI